MEQREKTSSNRMQLLREEKGLNMKEAAAQLQLPYTTYRNYEQGLREPNSETLVQIANFYGVSVDYLIGRSTSRNSVLYDQRPVTIPPGFMPLPRMVKKPLVGRIACGEPITAEQNIESYVDVPEGVPCDFCLECEGDSMIDAGIHSGDMVYIRIQPEVENGEIAAVRIGDEATLKKVYYDGESLILMPCNASYLPKTYSGLRRAELLGLRWQDVDLDAGLLRVAQSWNYVPGTGTYISTPKTEGSIRCLRISTSAVAILRTYKAWQDGLRLSLGDAWQDTDGRVFTSEMGRPIFPSSMTAWLRKFIRRTGLPSSSVHSLRHTYASLLLAERTPLVVVAHNLGHAQASTTANIYAHTIQSAEVAAAGILDRFADGLTKPGEADDTAQ